MLEIARKMQGKLGLLTLTVFALYISLLAVRVVKFERLDRVLQRIADKKPNVFRFRPDDIVWSVAACSLRFPFTDNCLTRALACSLLMWFSGQHAELVIGVAKGANKLVESHAWVRNEKGEVIIEQIQALGNYAPLKTIGAKVG